MANLVGGRWLVVGGRWFTTAIRRLSASQTQSIHSTCDRPWRHVPEFVRIRPARNSQDETRSRSELPAHLVTRERYSNGEGSPSVVCGERPRQCWTARTLRHAGVATSAKTFIGWEPFRLNVNLLNQRHRFLPDVESPKRLVVVHESHMRQYAGHATLLVDSREGVKCTANERCANLG